MAHQPTVHLVASQTTSDIYAARARFSRVRSGDGCWHQWTIALTLDGFCRWRSLEESFLVSPGDITITQPRTWMFWNVDPGPSAAPKRQRRTNVGQRTDKPVAPAWEVCYAVFHPRPHWHAWLEAFDYRCGMAHIRVAVEAHKEMARAMNHAATAYRRGGAMRDEWALNELERALMRLYALNPRGRIAQDERVCEAVEFIHERFADRLTVDEIAAAVHLSVSHLSTLFAAAMGVTPSAYLERIRLERAAEMLRFGNTGVAELAQATGYSDPEYFSRRFRLHYGQSPREYRNASRPQSPSGTTAIKNRPIR